LELIPEDILCFKDHKTLEVELFFRCESSDGFSMGLLKFERHHGNVLISSTDHEFFPFLFD
jgi:hypothetical protein